MFKYILFDLDNTLYDYENANKIAIEKLFIEISNTFGVNNLNEEYIIEKQIFQNYCHTASSHNKFIQIKKIFEKLNLDLNELDIYYGLYIDVFKKNLRIFPYVIDFLDFCLKKNIKMYILTNNTCKEQIDRLKEMEIINYFDKIYTSEEFGIEKPDIKLFYYIIQDINCNSNEIVKIGDNYKNDIEPLILNNIYAFWFNKNRLSINKKYLEFNCYNELIDLFKDYYLSLSDFLDISNYAGERFDLVQAGGGNTSFKIKNLMFIKSSGCCLSNMSTNKNYVGIDFVNIKKNINIHSLNKKERETKSKKLVESNIIFLKQYRPSIETTLHCLTKKFTLHIHPIQFNCISSLKNCDQIIKNLFTDNYCIIDYCTPGIDVTLELLRKYKNENVIFMKNHGLVVTSDNVEELRLLLKNITQNLEDYLNLDFKKKLDFKKYYLVNNISECLKKNYLDDYTSYLVENEFICNFINRCSQYQLEETLKSFFPDKVVYCGISCVFLKSNNFKNDINDYFKKFNEIPKIFIYTSDRTYMYISSNSLNKCREIEQVLYSHLICYNPENQYLNQKEIDYLNNWEEEKYRKKIN